jgi:hypothetical protein
MGMMICQSIFVVPDSFVPMENFVVAFPVPFFVGLADVVSASYFQRKSHDQPLNIIKRVLCPWHMMWAWK